MATQHSTQAQETVPVLFMDHPDDPDGVLEYVTPTVALILPLSRGLSDEQRADLDRVACAMKAGAWHHTAADILAWTPEQRQAALDALPKAQQAKDLAL